MPGTSDGVNQVLRTFKDVETLRREEYHRRRLLRLEQVRQQSKDVASLVRQKVQNEREKQLGMVQERVTARTHQWQVRKLKALQTEYEDTLRSVGKSHVNAANLPNEEDLKKEEADKILAAAQKRGHEALNRLKEEEAARRRADEERRSQLLHVRAVEEARATAVVALPRPESTIGMKSIPTKTSVSIVMPPVKPSGAPNPNKSAMPVWPKRQWPQQTLPLGISSNEYHHEQGDTIRAENKKEDEDAATNQQSVSAFVSARGDSSQPKNSTQVEPFVPEPLSKTSTQTSYRNSVLTTSNSDVKLYDYSSCYQSQYDKISSVVEKVQPSGEINAKEAAEKEVSLEIFTAKCSTSSALREQQRSKEALQRVQVQRDYKSLMGSLALLTKQNAARCSYNIESEKPWIRSKTQEDKLTLAVENLLQDTEMNVSDSAVESHATDTPDDSLIVSHLADTPDSIPRLNLALWRPQESTMHYADQVASCKTDSSPADSIIIAPPPPLSQPVFSARPNNSERDAALRTLVQRINDERHSLLSNQQLSDIHSNRTACKEDKERDIRDLEEKVLQQRQRLKAQRSEVKRLDASIATPACMKQHHNNPEVESAQGSSLTHESITIEHSHSGETQDELPILQDTPARKNLKSTRSKKARKDEKLFVNSPTKDGMMYSMDVSLSSVIMDQSENSSSGNKSVSLHGVQVLVKVCGTEEDTSESRSIGSFAKEDQGVKVTELSSDGSCFDIMSEDKKKSHKIPHDDKTSAHKGSRKERKKKGKQLARNHKREVPKSTEMPSKLPQQSKNVQVHQFKKESKSSKTQTSSRKVTEDLERMKTGKDWERKNTKDRQKTPQSENEQPEQTTSTSTSYLSPPDRVLSSLTEDIKTLIALAQGNISSQQRNLHVQDSVPQNVPLVSYINRLLAMSRESIDRLNVSCSEVSTPPSAIFQSSGPDSETDANVTDIGLGAAPIQKQLLEARNSIQDQNDHKSDLCHSIEDDSPRQVDTSRSEADQWLLHAASCDQGALTDMTKQCHEKISALTKMIEEVRRQAIVNSPIQNDSDLSAVSHNHSRSPLPLDSTAYMSPPPQVLEWVDIALPTLSGDEKENRMSLDPYGTAVMQLLADVRSRMTSNLTEPFDPPETFLRTSLQDDPTNTAGRTEPRHLRPKPPVAFWKNIERCNVTSPTEPHELSTILELGNTLPESVGANGSAPESPIHALSSLSTPGTPPDVIAELMRRNLLTSPFSWAKKMQKPSHSSVSSSSLKNILDSDFSSGKTGTGQSDISASKETNTFSLRSQNSSSNVSQDWKTNILMSPVDLYSSADEVEGDFRRMGIGWVGAMLRKTKEAGALSSTSSSDGTPLKTVNSDFKDVSGIMDEELILSSSLTATVRQGRGHSTPVKLPSDLGSSSGSHSHLV